ncbi:hypothetical protein ACT2FY_08790 [Paraburkholderia fungorum]|uniref:hypothetical protein n=1 Tax=Paraburkholderia fungorum TaxID=134537 RepID=UPI00402B7DA3
MKKKLLALILAAVAGLSACNKLNDAGASAPDKPAARAPQDLAHSENVKETAGKMLPTGSNSITLTKDKPSDHEVIVAIVASMNETDNEGLAGLKDDLASAITDLPKCLDEAETGCQTSQNGRGNYEGGLSIYENRIDCIQSIKQSCKDKIQQFRKSIADFQYRSSQYVFTVEKTNNYEGNIISYVDIRTKGTDETERDKITIQLINNKWVLVAFERVSNE